MMKFALALVMVGLMGCGTINSTQVSSTKETSSDAANLGSNCVPGWKYQDLGRFDHQARLELFYGMDICQQAVREGRLPNDEQLQVNRVFDSAEGDESAYVVTLVSAPRTYYQCKGILKYVETPAGGRVQDGYVIPWCGLW